MNKGKKAGLIMTGLAGLALLVNSCNKEINEFSNLTDIPKKEITKGYVQGDLTEQVIYDSANTMVKNAMDKKSTIKYHSDEAWTNVADKLIYAAAAYDWIIENSQNSTLVESAKKQVGEIQLDAILQVYAGEGRSIEIDDIMIRPTSYTDEIDGEPAYNVGITAYKIHEDGINRTYEQIDLTPGFLLNSLVKSKKLVLPKANFSLYGTKDGKVEAIMPQKKD